jgi:hypothetical protein
MKTTDKANPETGSKKRFSCSELKQEGMERESWGRLRI